MAKQGGQDWPKFYDHQLCASQTQALLESQQAVYQKLKKSLQPADFTILLPPPNITGILHLGHAWNGILQDFLIRYYHLIKRQKVYWIPGFDHAGIATQTKFEKSVKLPPNTPVAQKRIALQKWADQNSATIRQQWQKLAFFLDYEQEYYTLNAISSQKVQQAFVDLYEQGLIYQAKTLVNYDFVLQTAISNIEVIKKPQPNQLYYVVYQNTNDPNHHLVVATTRPETIFADQCLFVHPKDARYTPYLNQTFQNPLTKQPLKLLADPYVDPEFGTGVLKCTPGHDFNDYALGQKHKLPTVSCFTKTGLLNELCLEYAHLPIAVAKQKIVKALASQKLLVKTETITSQMNYSERSNALVEPMLSTQWFLNVQKFAKTVDRHAIEQQKLNFFPKKFANYLKRWLRNINDWCISRQLWWGHPIPCWYDPNDPNDPNTKIVSVKKPANHPDYVADQSVLDTWFSSGLLPITIAANPALKHLQLFPTTVLVTGFDIIFFWVARMLFFGWFYKQALPFKSVYLTGLIRDELRQKMSKSLGNGIDPYQLVEKHGIDVVRINLLAATNAGEDLVFQTNQFANQTAFLNKLWNCCKYFVNLTIPKAEETNHKQSNSLLDDWILHKYHQFAQKYAKAVAKYQFHQVVKLTTQFVWDAFCNTYLELTKKDGSYNRYNLFKTLLHNILILLHPLCPIITNFLFHQMFANNQTKNILAAELITINPDRKTNNGWVDHILQALQSLKNYFWQNQINNKKNAYVHVVFLQKSRYITTLKNCFTNSGFVLQTFATKGIQPVFSSHKLLIYVQKPTATNQTDGASIAKRLAWLTSEIARSTALLNNANFMAKAPAQLISKEQKQKATYEQEYALLTKLAAQK